MGDEEIFIFVVGPLAWHIPRHGNRRVCGADSRSRECRVAALLIAVRLGSQTRAEGGSLPRFWAEILCRGAAGAGRSLTACVAVARAFSSARSEEALAFQGAVDAAFEESPECEDVEAVALVWQPPLARAYWFESARKI